MSLGYKKQFVSKYAYFLVLVSGAFDLEQSPKIMPQWLRSSHQLLILQDEIFCY